MPQQIGNFLVNVRVLYADARPVVGAVVKAFDEALCEDKTKQLGQDTPTDQKGGCQIPYTVNDLVRPEKGSANLLVKASFQGLEIPDSPVIYNAKPEESVDLIVGGKELVGPSEFTQTSPPVIDLANSCNVKTGKLNEKQIQIIAQETGLDIPKVNAVVQAEKLADKDEVDFPYPEVFYALIRQNLPATRVGLLSQSPEVLRSMLESAKRGNIASEEQIDNNEFGGIDGVLAKFKERIVDHAFRKPEVDGKFNLSDLLSKTTPLSEGLQRKFISIFVNHPGTTPEFWEKVGQDADLKAHVPTLQRGLQLGVLTLNHVPLVEYLHNQELQDLRELARHDAEDWLAILNTNKLGAPPDIPGANEEEKKQSYATTLTRIFEDTYPTAVIANRLQRDASAPFTAERKGVLQKFFEQAPEFEFIAQHVDDFVQAHPESVHGISAEEKTALLKDLKSVQRLYKVMPQYERYANMRPLLAANLNSSQKISLRRKTHFVNHFSESLGGRAQAEQVYNNARQVAATTLNLYARFSARYNNIQLPVIGNPVVSPNGAAAAGNGRALAAVRAADEDPFPTEPAVTEVPSWTELFGPFHLCDCEHCRSVYSPAAYLVDILHFLEDIEIAPGRNALHKLLERRPDLAEIELSCKNTNTVLPYIDLVNEVLENAVAPTLFNINDTIDAISAMVDELDNGNLPSPIRQNFTDLGLPISANPPITTTSAGFEWLIDDEGSIYRVGKIDNENLAAALTPPQTRGTAEALSVTPENVNPAAYRKLGEAIYPLNLPFDLAVEQERIYLHHLGVPRYQLMEIFQKGPDREPTDLEIAGEYLGLTTTERQIITNTLPPDFPTPHEPWDFWGLDSNWLDDLQHMLELLKRASLSFAELQQLLNTRFINPTRFLDRHTGIDVKFPGTDCELEGAEIQNRVDEDNWERIDDVVLAATLDKMHRFLRLWRKLGWKMKELDQAITALNASDLTETFIQQLATIKRLQAELKRPVVEILSWWNNIDTRDYNYSGLPESQSFYEQLFLNEAVSKPVDPIFKLDAARREVEDINAPMRQHLPSLFAVFRISEEDLTLLMSAVLPAAPFIKLDNLSTLHRHVSFARALKLSLADLLSLKRLLAVDPFGVSDIANALEFIEKWQKIRQSSFKLAELNYLLRHDILPNAGLAPREEQIALLLTEIRAGAQKIFQETTVLPDSTGELTKSKLELLNWEPAFVEQAIAILGGTFIFAARLEILPDEIRRFLAGELPGGLPPADQEFLRRLRAKLSYVEVGSEKFLRFVGPMTLEEKENPRSTGLRDLSTDADYRGAVDELFQEPRDVIPHIMKAFVIPPFSAQLERLPALRPDGTPAAFPPPALKDRIYFDAAAQQLRFAGVMMEAEKTALLNWFDPSDPDYPAYEPAINALFGAFSAYDPEPKNEFIIATDANQLFDLPTPAGERFHFVLTKLMVYLRETLSENLVKQKFSEALKLEAETGDKLLAQWVKSPADGTTPAIDVFLAAAFAESNSELQVTAAAFSDQFKCFTLLHKIALLVNKFKITPVELGWIFALGTRPGWLNLNTLPVAPAPPALRLHAGWEKLRNVFALRDTLPGKPELFELFNMAWNPTAYTPPPMNKLRLLQALSERTGWKREDLIYIAGASAFNYSLASFRNEEPLRRFEACLKSMKRLGVSAEKLFDWAAPEVSLQTAKDMRNAVKSRYDDQQWLKIAKPLQDALREKQRDMLAAWLVAHQAGIENSNDLHAHYLIDVEMSACQPTSRLKQAGNSVQLFVQRCLMNLEPGVAMEIGDAKQWQWMKNYRVWEANRKVFLYPENWIEPELRDGKSPFFKDMENELMQNEITPETVEQAYLHYLERLDQVARLEIAGMYQDRELNILHVFGRTANTPHIYFYRRWVDESEWTPWEKVDLDIEGDHLIPVVWNRRLYLFWPIFTEKAKENQIPRRGSGGQEPDGEAPEKYWEIKLAWSENKSGKWVAKKLSNGVVDTSKVLIDASLLSLPKSKYFLQTINNSVSVALAYRNVDPSDYIGVARFLFDSCDQKIKIDYSSFGGDYEVPLWSRIENGAFIHEQGEDVLFLIAGHTDMHGQPVGDTSPILTLRSTPSSFRIPHPLQFFDFVSQTPFFYEDDTRSFFVIPYDITYEGTAPVIIIGGIPIGLPGIVLTSKMYRFTTFYHPYVCEFIKQLNRYGIGGLLSPDPNGELPDLQRQLLNADNPDRFFDGDQPPNSGGGEYGPTDKVLTPYPKEDIDFENEGAYALYNWELFFHAPLLIADRLSKNQKFAEALQWFHYIFNPTDRSDEEVPRRYWQIRPFFERESTPTVDQLMRLLRYTVSDPDVREEVNKLRDLIAKWRDKPFNPHLIARMRLPAYQKAVVIKYLDNLIAWGDQLFRRDTIESLNEATQLYILAAELLGPHPERIPSRNQNGQHETYNSLQDRIDDFSNALVEFEGRIPPAPPASGTLDDKPWEGLSLYFCIPQNDYLLKYWDTVADRLFKIRHCMNIEGIVRQLPLFEPPIDPGLLVRAAALGVDLASALNDINAALPHYRFVYMLQKAQEFCNDVRNLGAALLSALEKRDAEEMALLRASQEVNMLEKVKMIKEMQVDEAEETLAGLIKTKEMTDIRHKYYRDIAFMNPWEIVNMSLMGGSLISQIAAQILEATAGAVYTLPDISVGSAGWAGSPVFLVTKGGGTIGGGTEAWSRALSGIAGILQTSASMSATLGSYHRRADDWKLQENVAAKELEQHDKQIAAAEIRLAISEKDLENHELQIENAKAVETFMHDKFTNQELYDWMVGQIAGIYHQSYQMAYDLAKRVQKAFQHEIGDYNKTFIQFGYWDSLKKGLLAGDKLYHDLKRMELAYMDQNKREYELTKSISLAMLDPLALINLKETGECFVNLPEEIFDLDYAGHYFRRIKSVRLTLPCVTGPYTAVNCTLTLLSNSVRLDPSASGDYKRDEAADDSRFRDNVGAIQSIATSSGQNDSGTFELNFRDERYLPFEGAGAISSWRIELTKDKDLRQFDYDTITDVIVHVSYTAREGGGQLKQVATTALKETLEQGLLALAESRQGLYRFFSAKHEFSGEWHRFLHPTGDVTTQGLKLDLSQDRFPFLVRNKTIELHEVEFFFKVKDEFAKEHSDALQLLFTFKKELTPAAGTTPATYDPIIPGLELLRPAGSAENYLHKKHDFGSDLQSLGKWFVEMTESAINSLPDSVSHPLKITVNINGVDHTRLNPEAYEDMFVVFRYSIA